MILFKKGNGNKMKKKILSIALVLCLLAVAVVGTLAYFTDADKDVNVMTAGNVKIVQNETDREGKAYEDGQALLPAVYFDENGEPYNPTYTWEGPKSAPNGGEGTFTGPDGVKDMTMYTDSLNNEIDKVISVTNKGNLPAYIRTIILIENLDRNVEHDIMEMVHINKNAASKGIDEQWLPMRANINGVLYSVGVYTYENELAAGATSAPSLKQVWLDPSAGNAWYDMLGDDGELSIIAVSQAAQTTGFDTAAEALNTAFGEVTPENIADWVAKTNVKTSGLNNKVGGALDSETNNP